MTATAKPLPTLSPKATAAQIRKILRAAFPACRFSVTTARGAMVSAVDVRWTDGPTAARVDALVAAFEAGRFDGMTDSYDYDRTSFLAIDGVLYRPGTRYVHTTRDLSPASARRCAAQVATYFSEPTPEIVDGGDRWHVAHDARVAATGDFWSTLIYRASCDRTRYTLDHQAEG